MASQRIEYLIIELFGNEWMREVLAGWKKRERGCIPGFVETGVVIYVISNEEYRTYYINMFPKQISFKYLINTILSRKHFNCIILQF